MEILGVDFSAEMETQLEQSAGDLPRTRIRLEHLLRSSPAIIYSVRIGEEDQVAFISDNLVHVLGYEPREFLADARFWAEHVHPEDAGQIPSWRSRLLEVGRCAAEYRFRHKDGSYRWLHDDARVIRNSGCAPRELIGSLIDITALKNAEQQRQKMEVQLRQAQKLEAVGQLAAGIAHEINTPIQYVGDNTRFLRDSFNDLQPLVRLGQELLREAARANIAPELVSRAQDIFGNADLDYLFEQIPQSLDETLDGVARISRIVKAMKEFSHPGAKEKQPADLNRAIETTVTVTRNEWKYVAEMRLELDSNLPAVPCFLGEFNQVVLNLIVNAAHAIGEAARDKAGTKGTITIRTRRLLDFAEIRVSDTGTGIPESVRPRIFEPFFTTKAVGQGTGQGLSMVRSSIVKKHGGTVNFETELGKGTTFIVRLPLRPAGSSVAEPRSDLSRGTSPGPVAAGEAEVLNLPLSPRL